MHSYIKYISNFGWIITDIDNGLNGTYVCLNESFVDNSKEIFSFEL